MLAVKCTKQSHRCYELNDLMIEFRFMVNEAIRVGIEKNITSKFTLRNEVYYKFKNQFHTSYIAMAVFRAHALLKSYRKSLKKKPDTRIPRVKLAKMFLVVDSYVYKIIHNHIQIPTRPHEFVIIPLNHHVVKAISDPSLKLGNATLTASTLSISFTKKIEEQKPSGYIGIDMNLDNMTCCDEQGKIRVFDTSYLTKMKQTYREIKSHFKRDDVRIRKKIFTKYGIIQQNKENQFLHRITKKIASENKTVFMEELKGIRKLYRKGNGQGKKFRFKLNSWARYKAQSQIEYKSLWNGNNVYFVNPRGTSAKCSICDGKIIEENRMVRCPQCGLHIDRDVNASRNILNRGLLMHPHGARFEPDAPQVEAMKQSKDAEQIVASLTVGNR